MAEWPDSRAPGCRCWERSRSVAGWSCFGSTHDISLGTVSAMGARGPAECWLTDMDGVLVHEDRALPGAADFLDRLVARERRFLVLTNNSIFTPRDLSARLHRAGLNVPEESIWTSALATADFLAEQLPGGSAYVIGEAGLTTALHE